MLLGSVLVTSALYVCIFIFYILIFPFTRFVCTVFQKGEFRKNIDSPYFPKHQNLGYYSINGRKATDLM